jgi:hypothetical protein
VIVKDYELKYHMVDFLDYLRLMIKISIKIKEVIISDT